MQGDAAIPMKMREKKIKKETRLVNRLAETCSQKVMNIEESK